MLNACRAPDAAHEALSSGIRRPGPRRCIKSARPQCRDAPRRSSAVPYPGSDTVRRVPTGRISRLRRMLAGSNTLRRPVDRLEGAILMALLAVFRRAPELMRGLGRPDAGQKFAMTVPSCGHAARRG